MMTAEEIQNFLKDKPGCDSSPAMPNCPGIRFRDAEQKGNHNRRHRLPQKPMPAILPFAAPALPARAGCHAQGVMKAEIKIHEATLSDTDALVRIHAASFDTAAWSIEQIKGSLALDNDAGMGCASKTVTRSVSSFARWGRIRPRF